MNLIPASKKTTKKNKTFVDLYSIVENYLTQLPVETIPLAEKLGLKVYYVDEPANFSGCIKKSTEFGGDSGYAIFVNKNHDTTRRRFTIAHEISHFVLHQDLIGDGIEDDVLYQSRLSEKTETEANKFATNILMPPHLVQEEVVSGFNSVEDLAKRFAVSPDRMEARLGAPSDES